MSTDQLHMEITAEDKASPVVRGLIAELKKLSALSSKLKMGSIDGLSNIKSVKSTGENFAKSNTEAVKALRQRMQFDTRLTRQRVAGEQAVATEQSRTARIAESDTMRLFRTRMRATQAAIRQNSSMEREAERSRARISAAEERSAVSALRRQISNDRYRFNLRERTERAERRGSELQTRAEDRRQLAARRDLGRGGGHVVDAGRGVMDGARGVAIGGAIGAGILGKIAATGLRSRSTADTAEANLRMFGGQKQAQVEETRKGWLNRSAIENGFRPPAALDAYTEVLKAGIPQTSAESVTKSIMGASAGLDLNVADTTKLVGRLSTLTQDPKSFNAGAIDQMLNGIAVVAKVTAADSRELVSSLRRGAGVLGSSKMSVNDLTAFTGAGISAGMQEGKAGTFMDFLVNDLVNAKNSRGQRRKDLGQGFNLLGLGSAVDVSHQAANDPTKLLLKMFDRMSKLSPEKAGQAASLIGMREWRGEVLQLMKALPMLKQAVEATRDPKNGNHLTQARDQKLGTLTGLASQIRATFDLAWEVIGKGIEDIVREVGSFFLDLGKNMDLDVIQAHVKTLLDGFIDGLGFNNITDMLKKVFGKSGVMDFSSVDSFFRFAQGFGRGIRSVVDSILGVVRMFAGKEMKAESLGNLTAKIFGFAAVLSFISPFVGIIAGIGAAFLSLGFALSRFTKAGLLSGAGFGTIAKILTGGFWLGLAAEIGAKRGEIATLALDAITAMFSAIREGLVEGFSIGNIMSTLKNELVPAPLQRWLDGKSPSDAKKQGPAKALEGATKGVIRKQSYNDPETTGSLKDLIQKASISTGYEDRGSAVERLSRSVETMGARFQLASISREGRVADTFASGSRAASSFEAGSAAVARSTDPAKRFGSNFFTPRGMKVPDWRGGGAGAASNAFRSNGVGAGATGAYKPFLDYIAGTEGTAGGKNHGYDVTLANGKLLPGGKEQDLTKMTLDQIDAMQGGMLNHPGNRWNSSASGRYQIVRKTLRGLRGQLGLKGDELFDEKMQDRLGATLANKRGANAVGLKQEWASLGGAKGAEAAAILSRINPSSSASISPDLGGLTPSLDGLRVKGAQATGGGGHADALTMLSKDLQNNGVAGGFKQVTAFNDHFHKGRRSKHNEGLASDFTINDPRQSAQAAEQVRERLRSAGLAENAFKVIDEYRNPSGHATGGHIHTQFATKHAADQYKAFADKATAAMQPKIPGAKSPEDIAKAASGGWKAGAGGNAEALGMGVPKKSRSADEMISNVPMGQSGQRAGMGGGAGGGGAGATYHITQQIHGGSNSPSEIANLAQRKITEDWNHRAHDLEPELT